jgi:hypothetical protein
MFLVVRRAVAIAAAIALLSAAAAEASGTPSNAQIRAAVRRAERSKELWATVNICNSKHFPNVIGIRGQMPTLGFPARLWMQFQVEYWSLRAKRFRPVAGTLQWVSLGLAKTGLHQGGIRVHFAPHAGRLRGRVRFEWRLGGKAIGDATHTTTRGHSDADFGDPPHFSAWHCVIS